MQKSQLNGCGFQVRGLPVGLFSVHSFTEMTSWSTKFNDSISFSGLFWRLRDPVHVKPVHLEVLTPTACHSDTGAHRGFPASYFDSQGNQRHKTWVNILSSWLDAHRRELQMAGQCRTFSGPLRGLTGLIPVYLRDETKSRKPKASL